LLAGGLGKAADEKAWSDSTTRRLDAVRQNKQMLIVNNNQIAGEEDDTIPQTKRDRELIISARIV
jgi:hypothetical protein